MKGKLALALAKHTGKLQLFFKAKSPELLIVGGIVCVVGGTILACRQTLKAPEIVKDHKRKLEEVNQAIEAVEAGTTTHTYEITEQRRDKAVIFGQTIWQFVKLYGPSATAIALGIGCFLGSYSILKQRNVALMAAYKVLEGAYNRYRQRVIEEYGAEKDYMYRHGLREEQITALEVDPKTGKVKKVKATKLVKDPALQGASPYARIFSQQTSTEWSDMPERNYTVIKQQERYFNTLLASKGHVFLSEVYDALGFPRTKASTQVGWVYESERGDSYIDFDLRPLGDTTDIFCEYAMDFNVDGPILYHLADDEDEQANIVIR